MNIRNLGALAALLLVATLCVAQSPAPGNVRELTMVNIKYEGSNIWVPGPIICKKGDHVKLRLINNVKDEPPMHGFAIDEFNVKVEVKRGEPQTVEFDATKAGIFKVSCHLHLPHVGTQIVVLE